MATPEQIINELKKIDGKIINAIEKILGKNPPKDKLLQFLASDEYTKLIEDLGLRGAVQKYTAGFQLGLSASVIANENLTPGRLAIINANLELVKNTYSRTILGYYQANSELLRSKLISSIIEGIESKEIIKQLAAETPLTNAQVGSVVNTSYADYNRAGIAKVYEDKPEQRFFYEGGVIPTSSDECRWLYENQKPEGYTKKEIDAGIETPFTYAYGENIGQTKKIYWFGRLPNYNCIHAWYPIEAK